MHEPTCCFTGHRAKKLPWGYNTADPRCLDLKKRILDTVEVLFESGFHRFLCGMADGCDLYFCEAVLALRQMHPEASLTAVIPFPGQADRWPHELREYYRELLSRCDEQIIVSPEYSRDCMMHRNRYMVDHSDIVIACFDGQSGGTLNTFLYAQKMERQIIHLAIE